MMKVYGKNAKSCLNTVKEYDAIIVRNQTKVDQELLDSGIRLKAVGRLGVGMDNIDVSAAKNAAFKWFMGVMQMPRPLRNMLWPPC